MGQIILAEYQLAAFVDDLKWRLHAWQAGKGRAQDLMPGDHLLDNQLKEVDIQLAFDQYSATSMIGAAPRLPSVFLLRRKPVAFNRSVLHNSYFFWTGL